jgi:hypothetical protein
MSRGADRHSTTGISRSFRDLTKRELEDPEALATLENSLWGTSIDWDKLLESERILILSAAGAGKTYECQQQAELRFKSGKAAFFFALEGLAGSDVESLLDRTQLERLDTWQRDGNSRAFFFLDSVDELQLSHGNFRFALRRLRHAIEGQLHRATIIVTSRPIEVDREAFISELPFVDAKPSKDIEVRTDERFSKLVAGELQHEHRAQEQKANREAVKDGIRTVALLPLSSEQIGQIISAQGIFNGQELLAEIERKRAWDLARRPQELIEICSLWKEHGVLGNRAQQVAEDIRRKLKVTGTRKKHAQVSDARAMEGAQRLALALALTRKRTIRFSDFSLDDLEQEAALDTAVVLADWTENERAELLQRPLFGFASYGRVRFHHRSATEYLAAQRLHKLFADGHMPRSALFCLLFGERYGEKFVFPSMRAVATWLALNSEPVRDEMLAREPQALMDEGDPESFSISTRNSILSAYVDRYKNSDWRGVRIPYPQVLRFAAPELSATVQRHWDDGSNNPEICELLVDLIQAGGMTDCLDLADELAHDGSARRSERVTAIIALAEMTPAGELTKFVASLVDPKQKWQSEIKEGVIEALFPKHLSVQQFVQLLGQINYERYSVGSISWLLPKLLAEMKIDAVKLTELRKAIGELIESGMSRSEAWPGYQCRYRHLSSTLATLCLLELGESNFPSDDLICSAVLAVRLRDSEYGDEKPTEQLIRRFYGGDRKWRRPTYVAEGAFCIKHVPAKDSNDFAFNLTYNGILTSHDHDDFPWLVELCKDPEAPRKTRNAAFRDGLWLMRNAGKVIGNRDVQMREVAKGNPKWTELLDEWLAPPKRDLDHEAREAKYAKEQQERETKKRKAIQSWERWRKKIIKDPDAYFAKTTAERVVWDFYEVLSRDVHHEYRRAYWSRDTIVEFFNEEIADRVAAAFRSYWRTIKIPVRSERAEDEQNIHWSHWSIGLAGVYADADGGPNWTDSLPRQDAQYAARYAPLELNGIPPWTSDLIKRWPEEVDAILGEELSAQLANAVSFNFPGLLADFSHADDTAQRFFAPRIWKWLSETDCTFDGETEQMRMHEHLERAIEYRLKNGPDGEDCELSRLAETRLTAGLGEPFALLWITALMRLRPTAAMDLLETKLEKLSKTKRYTFCERLFAAIGERRHARFAPQLSDPKFTPDLLLRLVRLAYSEIKIEKDIDRTNTGTYSPTPRDDAQHGRGNILHALLECEGPEAWAIKHEMRKDPLFAHFKDRLDQLAREKAASEAEGPPLRDSDLANVEKYGEAPEADRDGMFQLMIDRLNDLQHEIAAHEFSERPVLARIDKEAEMQVWFAKRLQEKAKGAYRVDREAMVVDAKETDIRLLSVRSEHQAVIEMKLANNNYSLADFCHAIEHQLVGKYMKHENCRAGCLLITMAAVRQWQHPDSNRKMTFAEVIEYLKSVADRHVATMNYALRLDVIGIDLCSG